MSATNRRKKDGTTSARSKEDFYRTPAHATRALLKHVPLPGGIWCEPAAGDGAIIQAVEEYANSNLYAMRPQRWHAVELRAECRKPLERLNIERDRIIIETGMMFQFWPPPLHIDVAITNPPFTQTMQFVERCLAYAYVTCILQRLNWLGSEQRRRFFQEHPPDVQVLAKRPFPDATEYAWFVWGVTEGGHWSIISDED